ncbi:hypothetical protein GCM10028791_33580 [Echinicola sediminis]
MSKNPLDIATSIETIHEFLGDQKDLKAYESNKFMLRAVEQELEIIREATNLLLKISDARKTVNLRNWAIHAYDNVEDIIIWGIISNDLPLLHQQVKKLTDF